MLTVRLDNPSSLDSFVFADEPEPGAPGPGEIKVRIRATSLNYHDYLVVTGKSPAPPGRIPMSDASGEVVEVGPGVTSHKTGDHVISTFFPDWLDGQPLGGGFSRVPGDGIDGHARQFAIAPAHAFTAAPRGFSHEEAATLPCAALTAWRALVEEGGLKAGEAVLIQGTGGLSLFALQFALAMGAEVVATSSSAEKLDRLKAMGAHHVINYRETERWGSAAKAAVGRGIDHVIEVGGGGTMAQSISACRDGGYIALLGVLTGVQASAPTVGIMAKQLRVTGLTVGNRRQQIEMVRAIEQTGLRPVIDRVFELSELADAFRYQESGRHFGKIVVRV
jgi:NADPH:quinone reductase-like Zn-dependent oxidoreductase